MHETTTTEFIPFGRIALSLSGGGFRAAAYSLGALSYLDHIRVENGSLLDRVCNISSTSGGSITNAFYVLGKYQSTPFGEIYRGLAAKLTSEDLLGKVLSLLQDDTRWPTGMSKQRNLINAFARIYDEELYHGAEMRELLKAENAQQLQVSINSTEFYRGLWFRFHNGLNSFKMGNNYVYIKKPKASSTAQDAAAMHIKVADAVAASSCFPVGFEPILLPGDFAHDGLSADTLLENLVVVNYDGDKTTPEGPIGLMDGGITDNQGLRATMDANGKTAGDFDLVIVTDVTSYFMAHYEQPVLDKGSDGLHQCINDVLRKISRVVKTARLIVTTIVLLMLASFVSALLVASPGKPWLLGITIFLLPLAALGLIILYYLNQYRKKYRLLSACIASESNKRFEDFLKDSFGLDKMFSSSIGSHIITYFTNLRFDVIKQMVLARLKSGLSMIIDVNLKHTRRLIYDSFYADETFDNKRVANFIYELSTYNRKSRESRFIRQKVTKEDLDLLTPTEEMEGIAECARTTGTTLWFEHGDPGKERLQNIIMTGQFTTCANLMEYCLQLLRNPVGMLTPAQVVVVQDMYDKLVVDWQGFKARPAFLYDSLHSTGVSSQKTNS